MSAPKVPQIDERETNFLLSIVEGGKPKDQFEAILMAQMAAINNAFIATARYLAHNETLRRTRARLFCETKPNLRTRTPASGGIGVRLAAPNP
jgi:hypothetical protein